MQPDMTAGPGRRNLVATDTTRAPGHAFADSLPLQVWTALPDGKLDWVNARVLEFFGRTFEEMIGTGWQEFIHPDDLPLVLERWSASLASGAPYEVAFRLRGTDGEYRMHVGRAVATRDDAGQIVGWHGSNTDVEERQRVRDALRESQQRAAFLAAVSRDLAATLDYEETLRNIARMAVPQFADWCAVDVVDADGRLERLAVEHTDPARLVFVRQIQERYPAEEETSSPARVARTGAAEWVREISAELLEAGAHDDEHRALLRELGLRSYIIAPMRGRERARGAITLVYAESGRTYEEHDVEFVEELAARAAIALENAELVRDLRETRAMLEEQTAELEMQTEELQVQATHLEEQSTELEMSNAELETTLEHLARNEALLAEAQTSAHLGSWEWDMIAGTVTWTDEMYRLYGYEPQSVAIDFGRFLAGIHPDDRAIAQHAIERALATNGTFRFEHRVSAADGVERVLHCRGRVIVDGAGRPARMTGSAQDVTEARAAEAALRQAHADVERANRAKSEFLASMSHELRTPLNAIGGHVELITIGIHGPVTEAQRAALERIRASQEHLLGLINDILQFARVEAGKLQYRIQRLALGDVVHGIVGMLEPQAHGRGLMIEDACALPGPSVHADHDRLQQILINLVGNAIKFTDEGGLIAIACEPRRDAVFLHVRDTGRGIEAENLDAIFDPFVQVRSKGGETPHGVGLGLAISRDLARGMGGDLTVASQPGVGSTFTLRLRAA